MSRDCIDKAISRLSNEFMQISKSKQRTYVTLTDANTRKSSHVTVYDATPAQVIDKLKAAVNAEPAAKGKRQEKASLSS